MVVDVFRRLFGRRSAGLEDYASQWDGGVDYLSGVPGAGGEEGFSYEAIVAQLEYHKSEVERLKGVMVAEVRELAERLAPYAEKIRRGGEVDPEAWSIAAELGMKKRLVKTLTMLEKLLELVIARIRSAKSAEEVARLVQTVGYVMRTVNEHVRGLAPELAVSFASLQEEAETLLSRTAFNVPAFEVRSIAEAMPEIRELIREAMVEASRDAEKLLPQTPLDAAPARPPARPAAPRPQAAQAGEAVDLEEVAARLLDYIKANGGRLRVREAAAALGVTPQAVKAALRLLEQRGVIRLARGGGQAQAA